jgi:cell division protein YceG involved in septum cleavage
VVTLASLVERETPLDSERPIIAGIFTNRLARNMPLECDPTVAYALALAGRSTGPLDDADLRFRSPYNTYVNAGLPPGPIANPGETSLRAALDPPPTDYLYFVANTQGGHFFSKTLEEHIAETRRNIAEGKANTQLANAIEMATGLLTQTEGTASELSNISKMARDKNNLQKGRITAASGQLETSGLLDDEATREAVNEDAAASLRAELNLAPKPAATPAKDTSEPSSTEKQAM